MKTLKPTRLVIIAIAIFSCVPLTFAADRSTTNHIAVLGEKLYSIENAGTFWVTDLKTAKSTQLGKPEFGSIRFFFAGTSSLFGLDDDGGLFKIGTDGSMSRIGKAVENNRPFVATMAGDIVYAIDTDGILYATDIKSPKPKWLGQNFNFAKFIWGTATRLHAINFDGSLTTIDTDGRRTQVGNPYDWVNTKTGTILNGKLYTLENRTLFETDLSTGAWKQIGTKQGVPGSKFIFGAGASLYILEFNGNLHRIDPATGVASIVG